LIRRLLLLAVFLPAVALAQAPELVVATEQLRLEFTPDGDLARARACLPDCRTDRHVREFGELSGLLRLDDGDNDTFALIRSEDDGDIVLEFRSGTSTSVRRWRVPVSGYGLRLETLGAGGLEFLPGPALAPQPSAGFGVWLESARFVLITEDDVESLAVDEARQAAAEALWVGARNRFWTALVSTDGPVRLAGQDISTLPGMAVTLDPETESVLDFYLGPVEPAALKDAAPGLPRMMYAGLWFWLRWICSGLFVLLGWIHAVVPNWALAIMLLSLSVSILMRPLSRIADRLQDDVHRSEALLAPELREIRANHKGEEQSKRVLALYKKHGVHPLYSLKSLAGVAVVIPVFIGAFDMLAENIWLANESALWIEDLARPDAFAKLPFTLPFFGSDFNLLPFIMTAFSVTASMLHRHEAMDARLLRRQQWNLLLMALAFLALFYTFPAGMVLYWTTNNLISVIRYGWRLRGRVQQA
jgi:YidC/Oxa1 family membrane protein insertase